MRRVSGNMHRVSMHETSGYGYSGLENRLGGTKWLPRRIATRRCIGAALRSRRQYTARRRLVYMSCPLTFAYRSHQRVPPRFFAHPTVRILFTSHPRNPRCGTSLFPNHYFREHPPVSEAKRTGSRRTRRTFLSATNQRCDRISSTTLCPFSE